MTIALERVNGHERDEVDLPVYITAHGQAEAQRIAAQAEADRQRLLAEAEAEGIRIKAAQESERQRILNERAAMKLEQDKAAHEARMAELKAQRAKADRETAEEAAAAQTVKERAAKEEAEKELAEQRWKLGALGIYIAGALVSLPLQLLAFWDPTKWFLLAAPVFLEGLALVLSWGAQYAVTHGKAVWPYRVGVMVAAGIAAGVNIWHGISDPAIGLNAGLIGAITSLGGPIVWTSYEHGRAKKLDGVPTRRERKAAERAAAEEAKRKREEAEQRAAEDQAKAEAKEADELAKTQAKQAADKAAAAEQERRDAERSKEHPEVWAVAVSLRIAAGLEHVSEKVWQDAWEVIHGTRTVGLTAEIRARLVASKMAMQAASQTPEGGTFPQVESQMPCFSDDTENDPDGGAVKGEDRRKNNSGIPPVRRPGDTAKYAPGVGKLNAKHHKGATGRSGRRATRSGR
ncbi:hypothetical protein KV557_24735 [Kitasatospora aureofaciens]|uniref:hypothetical protein n=1 Tax=Kitasatospora aureofaciens TaxID=1894 RepID=UPI001C476365|nr:hypothetical protein [Kitasatospora aureofaciens]MBV6700272.1 hypothetical protein [Kitasatospora aureofaciens]